MIKGVAIFALIVAGCLMVRHDLNIIGGLALFYAGTMCGWLDAKNSNKLSDHLRKETQP